jgi:hypothetical protein
VYHSAHLELMRRRREWFERMTQAYLVLWWIPAGHRPGIEEASGRLELLRSRGPGPEAFTFRAAFPAPGADGAPVVDAGEACPAT